MPTPIRRFSSITFALLLLPLLLALAVRAQEKSVNPGINAQYQKNPDAKKYVASFEVESREVFNLRKQIVTACRLKPGMSVADVGAGTGLFTRLFAAEVAPGGTVYAADIAANFLKHIEATCKDAGIKNVKTVLSKVDSSELPPASVDMVFLCDVYHHFEFPQKTLASLHAALKPGGRLVVVDYRREKGKTAEWIFKHVRAGQEVVTREIEAAGFKLQGEEKFVKENYMIEFQRVEQKASPPAIDQRPSPLSYSRDIRPILAQSCFTCHGADAGQRKADLRLDVRASAIKEAIVPGKAAESPLLQRITSDDPDERMPPPSSKRARLSPQAVAEIRALDRRRRQIREPLGLHSAHAAAAAQDPGEVRRELGPQCDRPVHRRGLCPAGPAAVARCRSPHALAPPAFRPDRTAAFAGRMRGICRRPRAAGLPTNGRSLAGIAAVRRADGHVLAGRGPLRR